MNGRARLRIVGRGRPAERECCCEAIVGLGGSGMGSEVKAPPPSET